MSRRSGLAIFGVVVVGALAIGAFMSRSPGATASATSASAGSSASIGTALDRCERRRKATGKALARCDRSPSRWAPRRARRHWRRSPAQGSTTFQVGRAQISLTDASAIEVWIDAGPIVEAFDTLQIPVWIGGGTSPTNFWENQFFLTHFADRSTYGLLIRGWSSLAGPDPRGGALAMSVTPETCRGMCARARRPSHCI